MSKNIETLLEVITFFAIGFLLVSIQNGSYDIETWELNTTTGYSVLGTAFWVGVIYYLFIKD